MSVQPEEPGPAALAIQRRNDPRIPSAEFVCWPAGLKIEPKAKPKAKSEPKKHD